MSAPGPQSPGLHVTERGSGPPLLLLHGALVTGEIFEPVVERFAAHHRVIVPDLRGHGLSRTLPGPYTPRHLAADLPPLLERLGVSTTAVLGYSHGGLIAQQFALDRPQLCSRLVLACTFAYNMATPRERVEGFVTMGLIRLLGPRRFGQLLGSAAAKELGQERAVWLTGLMTHQDRRPMVATWKEVLSFDSRPRLGEIDCPTLIIAGAEDKGVPLHHAQMLHQGIRGSRLVVVDGATHTLLWTHPDQLLDITESFLLDRDDYPEDAG